MKNINRFVYGIAGMMGMLALFSCFMGTKVCAAEDGTGGSQASVVSSRTTDDGIYIYIKGVGDIAAGTTVQVGTTLCEDVQAAGVVSMGIPIRTTILLDNSLSVSNRWGRQAKELIDALIDDHAEGEEFRIITFADGFNVVADFSEEYDSLKAVVEEIQFYNQDSYLTDILYDLLRQDSGGDANFTRFIILTDGADDNDIKYTQTELSDFMKGSGVVIHTVGVKASNNNHLLENLFSYARLTGGIYMAVEGSADVDGVREMIGEDYSVFCLRLMPEADLMDGSRKEAKLNLNTANGMIVLTTSLRMPFADVNKIQSESVQQDVPTPSAATEKPEMPSIAVQPEVEKEAEEDGKYNIIPVVVIGTAVLVFIVLGSLFVLKVKKKRQADALTADDEQPEDQLTERIEERTVYLKGGISHPIGRQSVITLTDIDNPHRSFSAPIDIRIVIGRKSGDIVLGHDVSVSHIHCEIIKKGYLFYVNDLKSSNGTFYGNVRVYKDTPIMSGGILAVGKGKYKITIED